MIYKVAHLTSAHPRFDTRIFVKECSSLARVYDSYLIVADGIGDEIKNNVNILDVGVFSGRLNRILTAPKLIYKKALELDADLYHLHDPELISIGIKLIKKGKKVVFDAHEDLPKQILTKHYLPPLIKKFLSKAIGMYEHYQCSKFYGIVTATPYIRDKFKQINVNTIDINNFPKISEFNIVPKSFDIGNMNSICYVGAIDRLRGIETSIDSLPNDGSIKLLLGGKFSNQKLFQSCKEKEKWRHVEYFGFADRDLVKEIFSKSFAGLVTLHPMPSYLDSLPVKMFEYMAYGLPVIASDFPYWKEIIEEVNCGICVNALDANQINEAIIMLSKNPELCELLGSNGRKAVLDKFNWEVEEKKLFNFYKALLID